MRLRLILLQIIWGALIIGVTTMGCGSGSSDDTDSDYAGIGGCPLCGTGPMVKTVFVTESDYSGVLRGLAGADGICQTEADNAGLNGIFKAWLSNATTSPDSTFEKSTVPYKLVDGTLVADNWDDLTDGTLHNPIDVDAWGVTITGASGVWTNTDINGTAFSSSADQTCENWNSSSPNRFNGAIGSWTSHETHWTRYGTYNCGSQLSLYCFQQ